MAIYPIVNTETGEKTRTYSGTGDEESEEGYDPEFQKELDSLKIHGLDVQSRYSFFNSVFSLSDYKWRQVEKWRIQLL